MPDGSGMPATPSDGTAAAASETDSVSMKGLKSATATVITGGTFTIDSADDAVHTNGTMDIDGGSFTIATGDDAMHADTSLTIRDGTIDITACYEGIESAAITVSGGTVSVVSSDDGFNASLGKASSQGDAMSGDSSTLVITGGEITVNADGDGLDSNGTITVSGGTVYVEGPTNSGNGALDFGSTGTITGGTVVAAGSTGMDVNFGTDSTQGSILYDLDSVQEAGTAITLTDSSGNVLASYTPQKQFQSVVISAAGIEKGGTYTLTVGTATYSIEMTDIIYGTGNEMGGNMGGGNMGGGNMGGGRGGFPGGKTATDGTADGSSSASSSTSGN